MPAPTFRHLGDRLVHEGYIWNVAVATFEAPDGELLRARHHPLTRRGRCGAGAVRGRRTDRRLRSPVPRAARPLRVGSPGGHPRCSGRAAGADGATRDLIEEAGFRPARSSSSPSFYSSAGMTDSVLHVYLATDLTAVPRDLHGPEEAHMEVLRIPLAEAVDMVVRGEIHDAKTVIGLLLVDRRLRGHPGSGAVMPTSTAMLPLRGRRVPVVDGDRARQVGQHTGCLSTRPHRVLPRGRRLRP